MGKPLSGKNRSPFGVDGIKVDAAVLVDGTTLTDVWIYKQRSAWVFDLLDSDGTTVYEFVQLTGVDKTGAVLDNADSNATLVTKLSPGTFCISIVDVSPQPSVIGYATRLLSNKLVLSNGKIVYLGGYNFSDDATVSVDSVTLSPSTLTMSVSDTHSMTVSVLPPDATNKTVTFESSAPSVATINDAGVVTAISAGTSTVKVITVDGSKEAECAVTVNDVYVATVTPATVSLAVDGTQQMTVSVTKNGQPYVATPTYTSSSDLIFTVSSTGLVTAIGSGTGTLTIQETGKYGVTRTVTVA